MIFDKTIYSPPGNLNNIPEINPIQYDFGISVNITLEFVIDVRCCYKVAHNVECMQRAGVRGRFTIYRYCPCQRALNLQIALNFLTTKGSKPA